MEATAVDVVVVRHACICVCVFNSGPYLRESRYEVSCSAVIRQLRTVPVVFDTEAILQKPYDIQVFCPSQAKPSRSIPKKTCRNAILTSAGDLGRYRNARTDLGPAYRLYGVLAPCAGIVRASRGGAHVRAGLSYGNIRQRYGGGCSVLAHDAMLLRGYHLSLLCGGQFAAESLLSPG